MLFLAELNGIMSEINGINSNAFPMMQTDFKQLVKLVKSRQTDKNKMPQVEIIYHLSKMLDHIFRRQDFGAFGDYMV